MPTPAYTVTVTLASGALTVTHGTPNAAVPPPSILADPFNYSWGFVDEQIPNQLEPSVLTFSVWSTSREVAPVITRGQVITARVRAGGPAAAVMLTLNARVTEVTADLVPDGTDYPFRQTIKAADLLADLGSWFPGPRTGALGGGVQGFRSRLAWIGYWAARSVGVPSTWPAKPAGLGFSVGWLGTSAASLFELVLRSWAPNGVHHAVTPYLGAGYPAGYQYADANPDAPGGIDWSPVPDPASGIRYMVQPAGRVLPAAPPLPLRFASASGRLVLTSPPAATASRHPVVSAACCDIPATLRQGREHAPNVIRATGVNTNVGSLPPFPERDVGSLEQESTLEATNAADLNATGVRGRDIETMLRFRAYNTDPATVSGPQADAVTVVQSYLADASALAATWTFDGFTIRANDMSAAEAASALPVLMPAYLDDATRDGRLVRHLTIHSVDPEVRPDVTRSVIEGFIVAGEMNIAGGDLTFTVTTTPGQPTPVTAATPITVGEFKAAAYSALPVPAVHPNITVDDVTSVDA